MNTFLKYLFLYSAGHTYTNLSRLFLRLFVGVMFLQFGIRQVVNFEQLQMMFPASLGMDSSTTLIVMLVLEFGCSTFIMLGLFTRWMVIPPIVSMCIAEYVILTDVVHQVPHMLGYLQPGYLPIMFIGIFFFILLSGPGKISLDYIISLHFLNYSNNKEEEETLKEA